jgi:hypothetical protein
MVSRCQRFTIPPYVCVRDVTETFHPDPLLTGSKDSNRPITDTDRCFPGRHDRTNYTVDALKSWGNVANLTDE